MSAAAGFDPDRAWRLHPQVAVRPERFGALLYHFGTRRLSFLRSPALLGAVRSLGGADTARAVLAELDPAEAQRCLAALATLAASAMIVPREEAGS